MTGTDDNAKTYAKSQLSLKEDNDGCESITSELESIVELLKKEPQFKKLLESPLVSAKQRHKSLTKIFSNGNISDLLFRFLLLLNAKNRIHHIENIAAAARVELNSKMGRIVIDVTSVNPLDENSKLAIKKTLEKNTGKQAVIKEHTNTSLIGGVQIQIEDTLFDGAISSRLRTLADHIDDGVLNDAEWAARGFSGSAEKGSQ